MSDSIPLQQDVTLFGQRGLRLTEAASNGVHVVKHMAADSLGGVNTQYKWPAAPGGNRILQSDTSGNLSWVSATSGSGATTSLDNLSNVAIATPLLPAVDNTTDLDSASFQFKNVWFSGLLTLTGNPGGSAAILSSNATNLVVDTGGNGIYEKAGNGGIYIVSSPNSESTIQALETGLWTLTGNGSTSGSVILSSDGTTTATSVMTVAINSNVVGKFDASSTAGTTRFYLWDVDAGTLKQVKVTASQTALGVTGKFLYV